MKTTFQRFVLVLLSYFLLATASIAQNRTNDLSAKLQTGLFEEEANRNLDAAISAYQSLVGAFDKDWQIAATAVFRLGECYRKLGKTNEAALQYERIVREFADQSTLVTLSRQNLAGLNVKTQLTGPTDAPNSELVKAAEAAQIKATTLQVEYDRLKKMPLSDVLVAVQQSHPNPVLDSLVQKQIDAGQRINELRQNYSSEHPTMKNATELLKTIHQQIDDQVGGILKALESEAQAASETATRLQEQANHRAGYGTANTTSSTDKIGDEESQEISRLQAMIKNSPDLKNASSGEDGDTPLCRAATKGQLKVVQFLLEKGADVNVKRNDGRTPLHLAAASGHKAVVELLLSSGADVDAKDGAGWTALYHVVGRGYKSVAEVLLAHAADVNAKEHGGRTPLHRAADAGKQDLVESLLSKGADPNAKDVNARTPICVAAMNSNNGVIIKALLAAKADPNVLDSVGRTPLSYASEKGDVSNVRALLDGKGDPNLGTLDLPLLVATGNPKGETVELLLRAGANPNLASRSSQLINENNSVIPRSENYSLRAQSHGPYTPLQAAVARNQIELVKVLLKFKADPAQKDPWSANSWPLVFRTLQFPELLRAFLDAGADPNALNPNGESLLAIAALYQYDEAVEALLAKDASVSLQPGSRTIPLIAAVEPPQAGTNIVGRLLDAGAEVNAQSAEGLTPLQQAVWKGNVLVVGLLLDHGADPNLQFQATGKTPLHWATANKNADIVQLLLEHKADPNLRDNAGQTPLDILKGQPNTPPLLPIPTHGIVSVAQPASSPDLAELLRQHGARDDLPKLDQIEVRRTSTGFSDVVFRKGQNVCGQFTLFELLGVEFDLLSGDPANNSRVISDPTSNFTNGSKLRYPDLARILIRRPTSNGLGWTEQTVNVAEAIATGDCSADAPLAWGDVVEIPETDHSLNSPWQGFSNREMFGLKKCLTRQVEVRIKGETVKLTLAPSIEESVYGGGKVKLVKDAPFMIRPALLDSKLLQISSDLTRIKVRRVVPGRIEPCEWVVDCSQPSNAPNLWLRDGDVIEVPEKP